METLNKDFWDHRYINNDIGWDTGSITTPLKTYFDQLKNKDLRILIPGCGNAHEAEYLMNNQFKNVFILDISELALFNFKNRVPNFPDDHLINEDFFYHKGEYDLMIEQTFFCAISPSLRSQYVKKTHDLLSKNGQLVGLLFNVDLNENHPPFGGSKKEYLTYFSPYFNIQIMETSYNSIAPRNGRELFIKMIKNQR